MLVVPGGYVRPWMLVVPPGRTMYRPPYVHCSVGSSVCRTENVATLLVPLPREKIASRALTPQGNPLPGAKKNPTSRTVVVSFYK